VTKQTQADTEVHEDQLRNFLLNTLTGAFGISIAGNADTHGDTASDALAEFLGLVDDFDFDVKAVYVDREFYAVDAPFIDTLRQARRHYSKRFGIEATYRLSESSLISTTTQDATRRLLFVVISRRLDTSHQLLSVRWDAHLSETPATAFIRGCGAVSVPNVVRY
jgi:hypothetical protein